MLKNTFCHIRGIGEKTERDLWLDGVISWTSSLQCEFIRRRPSLKEAFDRSIEESVRNYEARKARYFAEHLPSNQVWRLFRDFQDVCAFVDIETTGLSTWAEITTAALYDGRTVRHYVNGVNLDQLPGDLQECTLLVTYNGTCFDIPFIERQFNVRLPHAHIDLRYPLRSLGLKGGLKSCERQLGMARPGLEDVDGYVAVLLWNEYRKRDDRKALETLLAYNIRDAVVLHELIVRTYNEKVKKTPFSDSHTLSLPSLPEPPFKADPDTVARVSRKVFSAQFFPSSTVFVP